MDSTSDSPPVPSERGQDTGRGLLANILTAPKWMVNLLRIAAARPLEPTDMYRLASKNQTEKLLAEYKANKSTVSSSAPYGDLFSMWRVVARDCTLVFITGVYLGSISIMYVIMLRLALLELQKPVDLLSKTTACVYSMLFTLLVVLICAGTTMWRQASSLMFEKFRSLLVLAIYDKSLRLSPTEYKTYDEPHITVLIMNDVERFMSPWSSLSTVSGITLLLLPEMVFLYDVLGPCSLIFLVAIILSVTTFTLLVLAMTDSDSPALRAADFRLGLLRELLKNIHIVKFHGWEQPLALMLDAYHRLEQTSLTVSRTLSAINSAFSEMLSPMCSSTVFILYVASNRLLSPDRAFTVVLMAIGMFQSITIAPGAFLDMAQAIKSAQRINAFFKAAERGSTLRVLPDQSRYMYHIDKCTIGWPSRAVVDNVDIKIEKGSLVAVTGPVGSGKSTFLSSLIGLGYLTQGDIYLSKGSTASSVMKNWAHKGSVRDNILFGREWDPHKYKTVVETCCLNLDFSSFPDGDLTEIGDGGVTLSGGQRTRVSLARCLYTDSDVYILDDVLAAVDGKVARQIFGKLRDLATGSKTVILSSNDYKILYMADQVVFLDGKGGCFCGSYDTLVSLDEFAVAVQSAVSAPGLESDSDDSDGGEDEELDYSELARSGPAAYTDILASETSTRVETEDTRTEPRRPTLSTNSTVHSFGGGSSTLFTLESEESSSRPYKKSKLGPWQLLQSVSTMTGRIFALSCILLATQSLLSIFPPLMLRFVVNADTVAMQQELTYLLTAGVLIRIIILLFSHIVKNIALDRVVRSIHKAAVLNVFQAPMSYFESVPMGRLMVRFTVDLDVINTVLRTVMPTSVAEVSELVAYTALVVWIVPILGIPLAAFLFNCMVKGWNSFAPVSEAQRLQKYYDYAVTSTIMEKVNGLSIIADHNQQGNAITSLAEALDDRRVSMFTVSFVRRFAEFRALRQMTPLAVMLPAVAIYLHEKPNAATLGLLLFSLAFILVRMDGIIGAIDHRAACSNSAVRLIELVTDLPKEQYVKPKKHRSTKHWECKHGAIEFRNTYFQYRRQLPFVLNSFDLNVKGGEKLGICGRTGAGKTTIFNALFRFSELRRGQILIDGQDIGELGVHELRRSLALIPQQTVLFRGTIRSNLDPTQDIEDSVLWDALRRSGFCEATTKIVHLDFQVEADGSNFSLGERQLIALARALVRRPKIILLDEATAAVDHATDRIIQQTIKREFSSCTVLCIAHRIQTILNYDKILALNMGGRTIEFGEPKVLYNRRGHFWEMCEDAGVEETDFI